MFIKFTFYEVFQQYLAILPPPCACHVSTSATQLFPSFLPTFEWIWLWPGACNKYSHTWCPGRPHLPSPAFPLRTLLIVKTVPEVSHLIVKVNIDENVMKDIIGGGTPKQFCHRHQGLGWEPIFRQAGSRGSGGTCWKRYIFIWLSFAMYMQKK